MATAAGRYWSKVVKDRILYMLKIETYFHPCEVLGVVSTGESCTDNASDEIIDISDPGVVARIDCRFVINNPEDHGASGSIERLSGGA